MSIWPEHPHFVYYGARTGTKEAIARLAEGPDPTEIVKGYAIGLFTNSGNVELNFSEARLEHFPDPGEPSHVLVWTPSSSHVFDYHDLNYISQQKK